MEGELNTGNMDSEMKEENCMFPTHITEAVNNAILNLLPEKWTKLYDVLFLQLTSAYWISFYRTSSPQTNAESCSLFILQAMSCVLFQ